MSPQEVIAALKLALNTNSWERVEATIVHLEEWAGPLDLEEILEQQAQLIADELGFERFADVLILPWDGGVATDMGE